MAEMGFSGRRFNRRCRGAQPVMRPAHATSGPRLPVLLNRHSVSPVGRSPGAGSRTRRGNRLRRSARSLSAMIRTQCTKGRERIGASWRRLPAGGRDRRHFTRSVCVDRRVRQREQQLVLDDRSQLDPAAGTDHRIPSVRFLLLVADHEKFEPCIEVPVELFEAPLTDEWQHSLHASDHPRPSRGIPCELDAIRNRVRCSGDGLQEPRHRSRIDETDQSRPSGSELFYVQEPSSARGFPHFPPDPGRGRGLDGIVRVADGKEPVLSVSKRSANSENAPGFRPRRPGHVANAGRHRLLAAVIT